MAEPPEEPRFTLNPRMGFFAAGDPVNGADPDGRFSKKAFIGATAGDFATVDTGWGGIIGQTAAGFIPIYGQIGDVRDTTAAVMGLGNGGWKTGTAWLGVGAAVVAWVPGFDWLKGADNVVHQINKVDNLLPSPGSLMPSHGSGMAPAHDLVLAPISEQTQRMREKLVQQMAGELRVDPSKIKYVHTHGGDWSGGFAQYDQFGNLQSIQVDGYAFDPTFLKEHQLSGPREIIAHEGAHPLTGSNEQLTDVAASGNEGLTRNQQINLLEHSDRRDP